MAAAAPAKGVMLCDRPVGGGGGGSGIGSSSSNGVVPFVSASNIPLNEQLGLPPCERLPFVRVQRDTVTHRHRRWLRTAVAEIKAKRDAEERKCVRVPTRSCDAPVDAGKKRARGCPWVRISAGGKAPQRYADGQRRMPVHVDTKLTALARFHA